MSKYVYSFGGGSADGDGKMKDVLGGKGAGLAEMKTWKVKNAEVISKLPQHDADAVVRAFNDRGEVILHDGADPARILPRLEAG